MMATTTKTKKKSPAYSYSRLERYKQCPKSYYFYIQGIPEPSGGPAMVGQAVHKFAEKYTLACQEAGVESDLYTADMVISDVRMSVPDEWTADVVKLCHTFVETHTIAVEDRPEVQVAFDRDFNSVDWWDRKAFLRCVMDKVRVLNGGRTVEITDYKTGWKIIPASTIKNGLQLPLYGFVASRIFPTAEEFVLCLDFIRSDYRVAEVVTRDEVSDMGGRILNMVAAIEKKRKFPARIGAHCGFCAHTGRCEDFQHAIADTGNHVPMNEADAVALAEIWLAQKAAVKANEAALKAWCAENGPIPVGDSIGFEDQEKTSFPDVEAVTAQLVRLGIDKPDIYNALTISKTAVARLLKRARVDEDSQTAIWALAKVTKQSRFGMLG